MKRFNLVSFILLSICLSSFGQQQKLLFRIENNKTDQKQFVSQNKLYEVIFIFQNEFLNSKGSFDKVMLQKTLNKKIPKTNLQGYAVIDWEGNSLHSLYGGVKGYESILHEFVEVIKTAKSLRPNVKWGYYGFPPVIANNYSASKIRANRILPILRNSDFIAPILYIPGASNNFPYGTQASYIDQIINLSLEVSIIVGKPVYPLIWHRYADYRSKNQTFKLVDVDQFKYFVNRIINKSYNAKKIEGLIWWNSEDNGFNYRNIQKLVPIQNEYRNLRLSDKDVYQMGIFKKYYSAIENYFK